jgi:predicted house-cleaning noncanonical NTP pyrophosphatase (MazG superfamily)
MGKLVRDRIPEIIEAEGRTPHVRVLNDGEYVAALLHKLVEEVDDLREAEPAQRLVEAADVYEILLALLALEGRTSADLEAIADEKRQERGGFVERWWWEEQ